MNTTSTTSRVLDGLASTVPADRGAARRELARRLPEDAGEMVAGLEDSRWRVRAGCLDLLSPAGVLVQERVLAALLDVMPGVRRAAARSVAAFKRQGVALDTGLIFVLHERVELDPNVQVRRTAAWSLSMPPRHPDSAGILQDLHEHSTDDVLLYHVRWALPAEVARTVRERRSRKWRRSTGAALQRQLIEDRGLAALTGAELVERLAAEWDEARAAEGLLFARGAAALPELHVGMQHAAWQVRAACAGLMDHLADSSCVLPLAEAIRDPAERVRRAALHSLSCKPCKSEPLEGDLVGPVVDRALHDSKIRVRRVAALALGGMDADPRAVAALEQILGQDSDLVLLERARHALAHQRAALTAEALAE